EDRHQVVMVVGHEPTISSLTAALADDDSDSASIAQARIGMPTGGLAILSGPLAGWADLGDEALTLHTIVRP
ncbi:MAG TPA: histidine phosphatase family protein, partial [Candidatus Brachybacterium merdigallinarum]|nr:histidine phosphatase family protein [Candidatus Brachybacterium merdigallinarum]